MRRRFRESAGSIQPCIVHDRARLRLTASDTPTHNPPHNWRADMSCTLGRLLAIVPATMMAVASVGTADAQTAPAGRGAPCGKAAPFSPPPKKVLGRAGKRQVYRLGGFCGRGQAPRGRLPV